MEKHATELNIENTSKQSKKNNQYTYLNFTQFRRELRFTMKRLKNKHIFMQKM